MTDNFSITIKNFKSYKEATLPLAPLTLLIGANASGKSNAIEAFRFLSWVAGGERLSTLKNRVNDSDKIIIPKKEENLNTESIEDTNESDINVQEKININTATKDELTSLNGIGEATANKIINYRNKNKFKEIEDIMNVPGIGEAKFNNIKDYICV